MRIGYLVKEFPKLSETFIAREILTLEQLGFEVTIVSLRKPSETVPHGWLNRMRAQVHYCEPREPFSSVWDALWQRGRQRPERREAIRSALDEAFGLSDRSGRSHLAAALRVSRLVEELELEHIHAHFANRPAFVAMLAHLICGVSYSFTAHAKDIYQAGPSHHTWRAQVSRARFAVTVSESNRRHIEELVGPELSAKVRVLYNGVDLAQFMDGKPGGERVPRILFVGRLIEKKGADLLIDAAASLRDQGLEFQCAIVGSGLVGDSLRARAQELSMDGVIDFIPAVAHERVIEEMRRSDVFVLPSRVAGDGDRDALPTVLIEAAAAGLPAVSTPVNGIPEIIEDGVTGVLAPADDAAALAAAIRQLIAQPDLRTRMAMHARERAHEIFDARKNVSLLANWFVEARQTPQAARTSAEAALG
jgi:colanic acid/amylovoran biosynthesis glycosyltransferase